MLKYDVDTMREWDMLIVRAPALHGPLFLFCVLPLLALGQAHPFTFPSSSASSDFSILCPYCL